MLRLLVNPAPTVQVSSAIPSAADPSSSPSTKMSESCHTDFDDRLRFQNVNCYCGLRTTVKISDKRNENRYRLFQVCPIDKCGFFQWCIPLRTPQLSPEDFQQIQIELCVLREELKSLHDTI